MPAGVSWPRYLRMMGASVLAMFAGAQVVHQYYLPDLVSSAVSITVRRPPPTAEVNSAVLLSLVSEYPRGSTETRRAADRAERLQDPGGSCGSRRAAAGGSAEERLKRLETESGLARR